MAVAATKQPVRYWDSGEVRGCIQKHFGMGGEKYAVLFEVANGTGFRANRSLDAVVMSLWPSLGLELVGMEIKISRSDWLRELKQPEKASETFNYFDRWYLVAPTHAARLEEIPEPWGWYEPLENGGLRKLKDAAKNAEVTPLTRNMLAGLMRRTAKTDDSFMEKIVSEALATQRKDEERRIQEGVLRQVGTLRDDAEAFKAFRDELGEEWRHHSGKELIAIVRAILKSGISSGWEGLHHLRETLLKAAERIDSALGDMSIEQPKKRR